MASTMTDETAPRGYMPKSKTDSHSTPQYIKDYVAKTWGKLSDYDPCPLNDDPDTDGLLESWDVGGEGVIFVNPPYSALKSTKKHGIGWVEKSYLESHKGGRTIVLLIPARTDTEWFHEFCLPHGEIEFIKGRIKFGDAKAAAPFPSMYVVFKPVQLQRLALPVQLFCHECSRYIIRDSRDHDEAILVDDGQHVVCEDCKCCYEYDDDSGEFCLR
tara:strand:+ start:53 stop:697 length:645 start_codon:yes stop_codon:yes gene_type:complete